MLYLWFPNCVPRCQRAPLQTQRGASGYFKRFEGNFNTLWTSRYQLKVIHSFDIRLCYSPFDDVISLQNWVCSYCCDKNQVCCVNQCGAGNEGGGVQSDSKV